MWVAERPLFGSGVAETSNDMSSLVPYCAAAAADGKHMKQRK
jgi:hypothetical protein